MDKNELIDSGPQAPEDPRRVRDAALVARHRTGDTQAFGELYDTWFDRVFDLARRIVHDPDTAAEVAQDAFLSAWRHLDDLAEPASFGGWLLRITRNGALNRAKKEARSRPVDTEGMAMIEQHDPLGASAPAGFDVEGRAARLDNPATLATDAELVALVREVADSLAERDAEVLDLQLRYQLTPAEVGQVLELNRNAANQLCHRVRARFADAFGARMLFHRGAPRCEALRDELQRAGVTAFGPDAVRIATGHAERCDTCARDRRSRLAPEALFAAVPLAPVLVAARHHVAHGLAEAGVPMHGSTASGGGPGAPTNGQSPTGGGATMEPESTPAIGAVSSAGRSRRVLVFVAAGVAAVLAVVIAVSLHHPATSTRTLAADRGSSTTENVAAARMGTSSVVRREKGGPSGSVGRRDNPVSPGHPKSGGNQPDPGGSTGTDGGTKDPTSTSAPPTTLAPVNVAIFSVDPATAQPAVWSTATGPVLRWTVTGAKEVTIWQHFDDGTNGDHRVQIVASTPNGSMSLCPGSVPVPGACTAPAGHYSYELVAIGDDGSTFSLPDRPGFDVQQPIIS